MRAPTLRAAAGLTASAASLALAQPARAPQPAPAPTPAVPLRVARVGMAEGRVVFQADWLDYAPPAAPSRAVRIFDCFGDVNSDGIPDDSGGCGLGDLRWFFGTGFCGSVFYTNDMTVADDTVLDAGASRCDFSWFWTAEGRGSSERCIVAIFTQNSVPCDPDSFDYEGWLMDYGTLPFGGYLGTAAFSPGAWPLPTGGSGSYAIAFLQDVTTSGAWVLGTCAQPYLWGTGDAGGAIDRVGFQGPRQFDDVNADGEHSTSECYTYSFTSICPSILGGMAEFWGERRVDCLDVFPNCDGDDAVTTLDFLCFLTKWSGAFQGGAYDAGADCDGDGSITTLDFYRFLSKFNACLG